MKAFPFVLLLCLPVLASVMLDAAKEHFAEGRFVEALEVASKIPPDHADYPRARFLAGQIQLLLGDADAAEECFRAALQRKPESVAILTGLGRALLEQDRAEDGVEVLSKAVRLDPKAARAICFLGVAKLRDSYDSKGADELKKASKLAPKDPEIARAVVLTWLDEEKVAPARKEAERFVAARKDHPMGLFLFALVLERERKYAKAIVAYEDALAIDDRFLDAHKNLAILCIAQNPLYKNEERTKKAMTHFERYRQLGGKDKEVLQVHETLVKFLEAMRKRQG